ncbi:MAG: PIN domain-containing protein [Asticcacaulis sp.]|nr:PIN domain-containing protein [Asticcacaulis sp.]
MPGKLQVFFDTNVLLYILSQDVVKAGKAEALLKTGGIISVQVLNEATNALRRKQAVAWPDVTNVLSLFRSLLEVVPVTTTIHDSGLALAQRYSLSVYDAMIVAAALDSGCETLWSEDMQSGLTVGRLQIRNPFI